MIDLIRKYWYIAIILALAALNVVQSKRLNMCHIKLALIQHEIDLIKTESKNYHERISSAEKLALKEFHQSDKNIDSVLKANIPADCEKSMQWGIKQAQLLKDN